MTHRNLWTLTVDDGPSMPTEFTAELANGRQEMRFTVHGNLWDRVGDRVRIKLAGGGRSAVGEGLVIHVDADPDSINDRTLIYAMGALTMCAEEET